MTQTSFSAFAKALTEIDLPLPAGIVAWNSASPERRFDVYRNNVISSLIEALRSRFPVTETIVGSEFFEAMAAAYIIAEPPRSPLLLNYGDSFPAFTADFAPAAGLPYLADIARIEVARSRAYHAEDRLPLDARALEQFDPAALIDLRLEPHPSLSIIRSRHPIATIWAMAMGERAAEPIENGEGEDVLIVRPAMFVHLHKLPPGGAVFMMALQAGQTLGQAVDAAAASDPRFDLTANLAGMVSTGAFTAASQLRSNA